MSVEIPAARLERLRELVSSNGVVSLREAQRALGVSVMTVRRDFTALEEKGLVRRTRGGHRRGSGGSGQALYRAK
ncbi:DeoR family transcriptional regulator [Streptomyces chiangmaiensis]